MGNRVFFARSGDGAMAVRISWRAVAAPELAFLGPERTLFIELPAGHKARFCANASWPAYTHSPVDSKRSAGSAAATAQRSSRLRVKACPDIRAVAVGQPVVTQCAVHGVAESHPHFAAGRASRLDQKQTEFVTRSEEHTSELQSQMRI